MPDRHVIVVGAGMGGLAAALTLAAAGLRVTVLERATTPGGKMRQVVAGGAAIDAGPTVFTMRWVFEELFAQAGATLSDHLTLRPAEVLARHVWPGGATLDLFADIGRSANAIAAFAGASEAAGYRAFCARAAAIYRTLEQPFIRAPLPTQIGLVRAAGLSDMLRINPFQTLMTALSKHFADPRLRQLFGRYATYCGSSPYLAPATLMLVAHVEQSGVWLVDGGMHRVAQATAALAATHGATLRYDAPVAAIDVRDGRAASARLSGGEVLAADAIVLNADPQALAAGCFGPAVAGAVPDMPATERSLSALTWCVHGQARGFPLARHTVFFGNDYAGEFNDLFVRRRLPRQPTVYVCAQDRPDTGAAPAGPERLLLLVNAPAGTLPQPDIEQCTHTTFRHLAALGLTIEPLETISTRPEQFAALFPATGGALYGRAVHGSQATFKRPSSRTRLPGLYLAGGATHPGAGVPMAALSGRLAAASVLADLTSRAPSRMTATSGGTSTR